MYTCLFKCVCVCVCVCVVVVFVVVVVVVVVVSLFLFLCFNILTYPLCCLVQQRDKEPVIHCIFRHRL